MEKKKLPKAVFIPILVFAILLGIILLAWGGLNTSITYLKNMSLI